MFLETEDEINNATTVTKSLISAVYFEGKLQGSCNKGLLIFPCAMKGNNENDVNTLLKKISTQKSVFGASMQVKLVNDSPTNFWLDSKN
jgi:D-Tyr-tRNAtyr deacylase